MHDKGHYYAPKGMRGKGTQPCMPDSAMEKIMARPPVAQPVKSYLVWFKPVPENKEPASYTVVVSESGPPTLYSATVIAMNTDTPVRPDNGGQMHWNLASLESPASICTDADNQLMALNPGKEPQYSQGRFL